MDVPLLIYSNTGCSKTGSDGKSGALLSLLVHVHAKRASAQFCIFYGFYCFIVFVFVFD